MLTPIDFARLVFKMRRAQRAYYRTKLPQALKEAKDYEGQVDKQLEEYSRKAEHQTQNKLEL